jgi:hypothetical protein
VDGEFVYQDISTEDCEQERVESEEHVAEGSASTKIKSYE